MKTLRLILAALILTPSIASAASDGGRPGAFLDYAASARSLGMGHAFTAIADDPSAIYWNPSGISRLGQKSLAAQFSTLADNANYGFVGYAHPTAGNLGFGVGVVNLQSGAIKRRDDQGNETGSYNAVSNAFFLSGAMNAMENLSFGTTAKLVREAVDGDSALGLGLDASTLFRANQYLQVGLMLRNLVAPSLTLDQEADKYPRSVVAGLAVSPIEPLTFGLDVEKPSDASVRTRLGVSYTINHLLSVRAGINSDEVTAGLGIGLGDWTLDYAMGYSRASSQIDNLGAFHRFGVQFNFGSINPAFVSAPAAGAGATAISGPVTPSKTKPSQTATAAAVASKPRDKNQQELDELQALGNLMDEWDGVPTPEVQQKVDTVSKNLKRGKYLRPAELYAAQGYVSYFTGEYARSVRSLEDALKSNPDDKSLVSRLKRVQDLNARPADRKKETPEIRAVREKYEKGDYAGTILLAQRLLEVSPKNQEASGYLKRSLDRLVQPYLRQAKEFLDNDRFVESFVQFQKVLDYDPDNVEAQAYSGRLVKIIEKKSDMDYLARSAPRGDSGITQGISQYQKGLRLYGHGDTAGARVAWESSQSHLKSQPILFDSVRSTLADLGR